MRPFFGTSSLIPDLFSRNFVGWAMSDSMAQQDPTLAALHTALGWRDPPPGLTRHSDRGSQFAAHDYRTVLAARGITVSMSRKGDCRDNAPMERANGTVKVECVHGVHFNTRAEKDRPRTPAKGSAARDPLLAIVVFD